MIKRALQCYTEHRLCFHHGNFTAVVTARPVTFLLCSMCKNWIQKDFLALAGVAQWIEHGL